METNRKLQNLIGNAIGKDYFKLEFGCKVKRFNEIFTWIGIEYAYAHYSKTSEITGQQLMYQCSSSFKEIEQFEILGQEPILPEILLAIQEKISALQPTKDKGIVCIWTKKAEPIYINLEKSIFNQEESVKVAIINLLEGK